MHDPEQQPPTDLIPPGGELGFDTALPALTAEDETMIAGGDPRIVVVRGHVQYMDVFNKARVDDFEYISEGDNLPKGTFRATAKGEKAR